MSPEAAHSPKFENRQSVDRYCSAHCICGTRSYTDVLFLNCVLGDYAMLEGLIGRACQFIADQIGDLPTILIVAAVCGLIFLTMGLTISHSSRYLLRTAIRQVTAYVIHTGRKYFRHLRWMGLTQRTCQIAVVCSVAAWFGILIMFAFKPYWTFAFVLTVVLVTALSIEGWRKAGKRKKAFKFVRAFYEPTLALTVPTFASKVVDAALRAMVGG